MSRQDLHSPATIEPAHYEFLGIFYQGTSEEMYDLYAFDHEDLERRRGDAPAFQGNFEAKGTCDHCGASFAHGTVYLHRPTGETISVGHVCAGNTLDYPSRAAARKAKIEKLAAKRREVRNRQDQAAEQHPEAASILRWYRSGNPFVADVANRFRQKGYLSPKQAAAIVRAFEKDLEREYGTPDAPKAPEAPAGPAPKGRQPVTGTVLRVKERVDRYTFDLKYGMTLKLDNGSKVWTHVPAPLLDAVEYGYGWLEGKTVTVNATWSPKDDDPAFAFGKNPRALKDEVARVRAAWEADNR